MFKVEKDIIKPTIDGLHKEDIDYKGFIFFGLINVNGDPYVIEYNCRLGDPETEVVIPRLENDLVGLFISACNQELNEAKISVDNRSVATIMAVSRGYPVTYEKGYEIYGLKKNYGKDSLIFQAGTTENAEKRIVTNGGRVLCVTSYGKNIADAAARSLEILKEEIDYDGIYYRTDIGYEFS